MRQEDSGRDGDGRYGGCCGTFPSPSSPVDQGYLDVEHYLSWRGGEVLDGINTWNGPQSVPKSCYPGPQAQYILIPIICLSPWSNPEGSSTLPRYAHTDPTPSTQYAILRGHYFFLPPTFDSQETSTLMRAQLLDLIVYLEVHQFRGLSPDIPGQIPTPPSRPRPKGEVFPGKVLVEARSGGGNSGGFPPRFLPPPDK